MKPLAPALEWVRRYTDAGNRVIVSCAGTAGAIASEREYWNDVDKHEDGDKRTLVCGDVLEHDETDEMATYDPSDQDYIPSNYVLTVLPAGHDSS